MYFLYGTECVVQSTHFLMVCMELLLMWMCRFLHMLKLNVLMCSLKSFRVNLLSMWNMSKLKPIALYMLMNTLNYFMILYALFEIKFSGARKGIMDEFLWRKDIPFILKMWWRNISVGSGTIGKLLYGFLRRFMPPWRSGLDVPYMWLALA